MDRRVEGHMCGRMDGCYGEIKNINCERRMMRQGRVVPAVTLS